MRASGAVRLRRFRYVTATLATVGRDAENDEAELAGAKQLSYASKACNPVIFTSAL